MFGLRKSTFVIELPSKVPFFFIEQKFAWKKKKDIGILGDMADILAKLKI